MVCGLFTLNPRTELTPLGVDGQELAVTGAMHAHVDFGKAGIGVGHWGGPQTNAEERRGAQKLM